MTFTPEPFSTRLQSLMTQAGLSASDLARASGLSRQVIAYYLSGQREPHLDALRSLAKALGGSLSLFDETHTS